MGGGTIPLNILGIFKPTFEYSGIFETLLPNISDSQIFKLAKPIQTAKNMGLEGDSPEYGPNIRKYSTECPSRNTSGYDCLLHDFLFYYYCN